MNLSVRHAGGFTLIETLLALAILGILSVIGISSLSGVHRHESLVIEAENIVSLLSRARQETLAAKDESVYGVHFETNAVVLFKGSAYVPGAAANEVHQFPDFIAISSTFLTAGGANVVFRKLTGAVVESGTITLALRGEPSNTKTITIAPTGVASSN